MRFPAKLCLRSLFILALLLPGPGDHPLPSVRAQGSEPIQLTRFDLLTPTSGWVLLDRRLYWTSDAGQTWEEIGPPNLAEVQVQDVEFIDTDTGWVLWASAAPGGGAAFGLAHTTDGGAAWTSRFLSLFEPGEAASYAEGARMGWLDAQTGWISVRGQTGSNFHLGTLFTTVDGGTTWRRSALPAAGDLHFDSARSGWAVGGPGGGRVFRTQDAGDSWEALAPPGLPEDSQATAYPPFVSGGQGLLVMTALGEENTLRVYSLDDSMQWSPAGEVRLDGQPGRIGLSILDPRSFVAVIPGTGSLVRMLDGNIETIENRDGLSAHIAELDMVSPQAGWEVGRLHLQCGSGLRHRCLYLHRPPAADLRRRGHLGGRSTAPGWLRRENGDPGGPGHAV